MSEEIFDINKIDEISSWQRNLEIEIKRLEEANNSADEHNYKAMLNRSLRQKQYHSREFKRESHKAEISRRSIKLISARISRKSKELIEA